MEKLNCLSRMVKNLDKEKFEEMGPSLSGSFMDLSFKEGSGAYYAQFGENVEKRYLIGSNGKVKSEFTAFTRDLYQKDKNSLVKVLFIVNARTVNTRESLVGWSEKLFPEILKLKKEFSCSHALFFLSRREKWLFDFFIRPRKKREDQIKFSHVRGASIQIVQGTKFSAQAPLKYVKIRRAKEEDLQKLSGYIKQASMYAPLSRNVGEEQVLKEFKTVKNFSPDDVALAFNSNGEIVGSLGAVDMANHADIKFKFNDLFEPTFNVLQGYLRLASWVADLRPVLEKKIQNVRIFTHMYFNNHDIFYSLIYWWIEQTKHISKKERPVFLYPFYMGDLKAAAPESLFISSFKGDIYLIQDEGELPSELLKPVLFSQPLDIDLTYLI